MIKFFTLIFLLGLVIGMPTAPALGQSDVCPALVSQALQEVGSRCDALGRNVACYGFNRVDATFFESLNAEYFSQPADRADLATLRTIQTASLDVAETRWGIAVLNVQADVPGTLPGQAVTFLLLGDVEIENAQSTPSEAVTSLSGTTRDYLNLRSQPSDRANVLMSIPPSSEILVDGISSDGLWLRSLYQNEIGWVYQDFVDITGDSASLSIVDQIAPGPMQAFFLHTGLTGVSCQEAPPSQLVIQSPQNLRVNLTINGVDLSIGSTVSFRAAIDSGLRVAVIDGHAELDGLVVPAGFTVSIPLSADGRTPVGPPENLRPLTPEELAELETLEGLPDNLLHYPIDAPTMDDVIAFLNAIEPNNPAVMELLLNSAVVSTPSNISVPTATETPTPTFVIGTMETSTVSVTPGVSITAQTTPEVTPDVTPEITPDVTPEVTPDVTPEVTPDVTPEVTPDVTPEVTPDIQPAPRLVLTSVCSSDPMATRRWRVRNTNTTAINFTWEVEGLSGSGSVGPGSDVFFETPTVLNPASGQPTPNTLSIFVNGDRQDTKASGGASC